jgi:hypothetical protein
MPDDVRPPLFTIGRIASWVVVALMLGSIVYSVWIGLANWSAIMV